MPFYFQTLIKSKKTIHLLFFYLLLLETAPKTQNISKFTKKQEMFAKWTRDGVQHQFNKNWLDREKWGFSGTHSTSYIRKKSKCIPLPEQNYFSHFAMRYPVHNMCR